jgi:uncharacterized protein involved in copper resistance
MRLVFGTALSALFLPLQAYAVAGMHMPEKIHAFKLEQLEIQTESSAVAHLKGWYGTELSKTTWAAEWREIDNEQSTELSIGHAFAIDPFWDAGPVLSFEQEDDGRDTESETWLGWQFKGTAPYFVHVDINALVGKHQQAKIEIEAEHDFPLSRSWMLQTKLDLELGSFVEGGNRENELESWRLGWRVKYETVERFSYYLGLEFANSHIPESKQWRGVAGLSWWW